MCRTSRRIAGEELFDVFRKREPLLAMPTSLADVHPHLGELRGAECGIVIIDGRLNAHCVRTTARGT